MQSRSARSSTVLVSLLAIASALTLPGCGGTRVVQEQAEPSSTDARVYFIRKKFPPYLYTVSLKANGVLLASIRNDDYVVVKVPLGMNKIEFDAPLDGKDFEFELPVTSDPMYVLVTNDGYDSGGTTIIQTSAVVTPTVLVDINWRFRFSPISRAEAQRVVEELGREWK